MNTMTLGSIRKMRRRTQQDVAAALGDTTHNHSAAYHAERSPLSTASVSTLDRYAEALGGQLLLAIACGDQVYVLSDPEDACPS